MRKNTKKKKKGKKKGSSLLGAGQGRERSHAPVRLTADQLALLVDGRLGFAGGDLLADQ